MLARVAGHRNPEKLIGVPGLVPMGLCSRCYLSWVWAGMVCGCRDAIHKLYLRYKDPDSDQILAEGIAKLCEDLGGWPPAGA